MPPFYVYRNLHRGDFSVRFDGLVIDHLKDFIAHDVRFKINEGGRLATIRDKQKTVHAFVVTNEIETAVNLMKPFRLEKVCYNPYDRPAFMCKGREIHTARRVLFTGGRCYVVT